MKKRPLLSIGQEFTHPGTGHVHRVTDVGSRTFLTIDTTSGTIAARDSETGETTTRVVTGNEWQSWLSGPPYAVAENVWDEYDQEVLRDVEGINWVDVSTSEEMNAPRGGSQRR
ncbi:MAG TPA: hypothetical protein VFQ61_09070 [Polyangiaceae bacterium]|nr:hypothetical protein [Polyangiaceae bacterium]